MIRTSSKNLINQSITILRTNLNVTRTFKNDLTKRNYTKEEYPIKKSNTLTYSPTEGYIRTSPYEPITIPDVPLHSYVWADYHKWENKIATVCIETNRQYTFAQLRDCSAALAINLQKKLKLNTRDVIAVCLPNVPEYPICVFGGLEAGLTISTTNPAYTAHEIARQLSNSNATCVISVVTNCENVKNACKIAEKDIPIICIRTKNTESLPAKTIDFYNLIQTEGINFSELRSNDITPEDLAFLPYSSGTTGLPKGVMLTHQNITSDCEMLRTTAPYEPFVLETTDTYQEVIPCILPFFHIYGLTVCMISKLMLGCKLTTLMKFTPEDFIRSIDEYKGTMLNLVPPMVLFLTNSPKINNENAKHLRTVMCGAAPIGATDAEKFLVKFPHVSFTQGYGLTETSPVVLMSPFGCKNYAAAGLVISSTSAKIVSYEKDDGVGLQVNETGELWIRGPQVMKGYLNNEEANRDIFRGNWMRTGDVGYYDDDGFFYIKDRMKELIKVKGFQVPPAELEEILRDHPKIIDAAVIGIPHSQKGEVPKAFVVVRPGHKVTAEEIQDFVKDKVIHYKQLEGGVEFLQEIPKTASGKILRKDLKQKYL